MVNEYLPVVRRYRGEEGPVFVHTDSVLREGGRTFVLRLRGVSFGTDSERGATGGHQPEKVEIELTNDYMTVIRWTFRGVREGSDLEEGDFLIVGPHPSYMDGVAVGGRSGFFGPVILCPWSLPSPDRPQVSTSRAIISTAGQPGVFLVEDDRARLVDVAVHETSEELQRITGDAIAAGAHVVVGGAHYLSDGQPVTVVDQ